MMAGGPGVGWAWLVWLLLVVGVVALVVVVARAVGGGTGPPTDQQSVAARPGRGRARALLDERYARGDITTAEYRQRLSALGEDP